MELKIKHQVPTGDSQHAYYYFSQEYSTIKIRNTVQISVTKFTKNSRFAATLYPFSYRQLQAYIYIGWGSVPCQTVRSPISQHKNVPHFVPSNQINEDCHNINAMSIEN